MKEKICQSRKYIHIVFKPQHGPNLAAQCPHCFLNGTPLCTGKSSWPWPEQTAGLTHLVLPPRDYLQMAQTDDTKGKLTCDRTVSMAEMSYLLCDCCLFCWDSLSVYASSVIKNVSLKSSSVKKPAAPSFPQVLYGHWSNSKLHF